MKSELAADVVNVMNSFSNDMISFTSKLTQPSPSSAATAATAATATALETQISSLESQLKISRENEIILIESISELKNVHGELIIFFKIILGFYFIYLFIYLLLFYLFYKMIKFPFKLLFIILYYTILLSTQDSIYLLLFLKNLFVGSLLFSFQELQSSLLSSTDTPSKVIWRYFISPLPISII